MYLCTYMLYSSIATSHPTRFPNFVIFLVVFFLYFDILSDTIPALLNFHILFLSIQWPAHCHFFTLHFPCNTLVIILTNIFILLVMPNILYSTLLWVHQFLCSILTFYVLIWHPYVITCKKHWLTMFFLGKNGIFDLKWRMFF